MNEMVIRIAKKVGTYAAVGVIMSYGIWWQAVSVCHYNGGGVGWFVATLLTCSY